MLPTFFLGFCHQPDQNSGPVQTYFTDVIPPNIQYSGVTGIDIPKHKICHLGVESSPARRSRPLYQLGQKQNLRHPQQLLQWSHRLRWCCAKCPSFSGGNQISYVAKWGAHSGHTLRFRWRTFAPLASTRIRRAFGVAVFY